jgi:formate dehydrogenase (coenzyme F420) alpha subunit
MESPVSASELARRYPVVLNAGAKSVYFTHSRHRSLCSLRSKEPEPRVDLHPTTAAEHQVRDGELVRVETPRGSITLKTRVTESIRPGVAGLAHGWAEASANLLTDHEKVDPILGCPPLRSGLCRIVSTTHRDKESATHYD